MQVHLNSWKHLKAARFLGLGRSCSLMVWARICALLLLGACTSSDKRELQKLVHKPQTLSIENQIEGSWNSSYRTSEIIAKETTNFFPLSGEYGRFRTTGTLQTIQTRDRCSISIEGKYKVNYNKESGGHILQMEYSSIDVSHSTSSRLKEALIQAKGSWNALRIDKITDSEISLFNLRSNQRSKMKRK